MAEESLFDFKNRVADCPYLIVSGVPVCGFQEIAQDSHGLGQLVHKEIMIRAQALNRWSYFIRRGHARPIGFHVVHAIYHGGKEMKMLGPDVNCQPRPEKIQPGMADCDIAGIQSLPQLPQHFIQSGVIVD
jgi:hypothetical protein